MSKKQLQICDDCDIPGLYVTGIDDFYTIKCPFCQFHIKESDLELDNDYDIIYCKQCKVIFTKGCIHGTNIYNTGIMSGYTYNNNNYNGMLVFNTDDSVKEFAQLIKSKKLQVSFECSCNGNEYTCTKVNDSETPHTNKIIIFGS
jgi:hypothetical protein